MVSAIHKRPWRLGKQRHQLGLAVDAHLAEDGFEMRPHGRRRQLRELRVVRNRAAFGDEQGDARLGRREGEAIGQPYQFAVVAPRQLCLYDVNPGTDFRKVGIPDLLQPLRQARMKSGIVLKGASALLQLGEHEIPIGFAVAARHGGMMATVDAAEQWVPAGIHVLPAEADDHHSRLRRLRHRFACRLSQIVVRRLTRRWLAALEGSKEDVARALTQGRQAYQRLDRPFLPMMEAEADKVPAPHSGRVAGKDSSPPVPSDWFAPRQRKSRGVVFYVHGGSFIIERSPRITSLVARFAAAAQARVFAPNYRLAPEHPCPAAVDDIAAAYRWHRTLWPDEPIVALAESAGAAILLAALQKLRDAGDALPAGIVLLSPWVDLSLQSWSVMAASITGTTPYTMESLGLMAHLYLQGRPATDPVASPLYGDFRDFPPMLIHASQDDILYDDALRLAERVRAAAGNLTVRFWSGETHVWERMHSVKARESISFAAKFIRQRLDATGTTR